MRSLLLQGCCLARRGWRLLIKRAGHKARIVLQQHIRRRLVLALAALPP